MGVRHCDGWPDHSFGCPARQSRAGQTYPRVPCVCRVRGGQPRVVSAFSSKAAQTGDLRSPGDPETGRPGSRTAGETPPIPPATPTAADTPRDPPEGVHSLHPMSHQQPRASPFSWAASGVAGTSCDGERPTLRARAYRTSAFRPIACRHTARQQESLLGDQGSGFCVWGGGRRSGGLKSWCFVLKRVSEMGVLRRWIDMRGGMPLIRSMQWTSWRPRAQQHQPIAYSTVPSPRTISH